MQSALRLPGVVERIGLRGSTIWDRLNPKSKRYDPTFPKPFKIGQRAVAWDAAAVDAWLSAQIAASRAKRARGAT